MSVVTVFRPPTRPRPGSRAKRAFGERKNDSDCCVAALKRWGKRITFKTLSIKSNSVLREGQLLTTGFIGDFLMMKPEWELRKAWYGGDHDAESHCLEGLGMGPGWGEGEGVPYPLYVIMRYEEVGKAKAKTMDVVMHGTDVKNLIESLINYRTLPATTVSLPRLQLKMTTPELLDKQESDSSQQEETGDSLKGVLLLEPVEHLDDLLPAVTTTTTRPKPSWWLAMMKKDKIGRVAPAPDEEKKKKYPGLHNLGNTCFMNAALQCLSHTPDLRDFFLTDQYVQDINVDNFLGCEGELAEAYARLMVDMWSGEETVVRPSQFKEILSQFAPQFEGQQQHDTQELLAFLLDGIHEDLNRIQHKPFVESLESDGTEPDQDVATESWRRHLLRNQSIIVDLFQGQLRSEVECRGCSKLTITFDPVMYLSLPLRRDFDQNLTAIDVTYIPDESPSVNSRKLRLELPSTTTIASLREEIGRVARVNPTSMLMVDIYNKKAHGILVDEEKIIAYRSYVAYECPMLSVENFSLSESLRVSIHLSLGQYRAVHWPLVLVIPKNMTNLELYQTVAKKVNLLMGIIIDDLDDTNFPFTIQSAAYYDCPFCRTYSMCGGCKFSITDETSFLNIPPIKTDGKPTFVKLAAVFVDEPARTLENAEWVLMEDRSSLTGAAANNNNNSSSSNNNNRSKTVTLSDCLNLFSRRERLDVENLWYCPHCQDHTQAFKTMKVWQLPDYLVIHLKRFDCSSGSGGNRRQATKLHFLVDFPLEGFDMSPWLAESCTGNGQSTLYDLYGVSNHSGSISGGHYTADCQTAHGWMRFNDSWVSDVVSPLTTVVSEQAYVLFYRRRQT